MSSTGIDKNLSGRSGELESRPASVAGRERRKFPLMEFGSPYPGLRSFTQNESSIFFGREPQIRQLRNILAKRNLLVILGGSGSGKSSLVRAGLLPKLNSTDPIPGRSGAWYTVEFRPKLDPAEEFLDAVFSQIFEGLLFPRSRINLENADERTKFEADECTRESERYYNAVNETLNIEPRISPSDLRQSVERSCRKRLRDLLLKHGQIDPVAVFEFADRSLPVLDRLLAAERPRSGSAHLLILIDQFEEIFSLSSSQRGPGLDAIMTFITTVQSFQPQNLFIVITMRNEWLHRCSEFQGVAEAMNGSTYLVDLLAESDIEEVIVEPARSILRLAGVEYGQRPSPFSREVIRVLQGAFGSTPPNTYAGDQLPLLQHLLPQIWETAVRRCARAPGWKDFSVTIEDLHLVVPKSEWISGRPLATCLDTHANRVLLEALNAAQAASPAVDVDSARRLLQVAFTSLAIQDDKGIIRRRFSSIEEMLSNSSLIERTPEIREHCRAALAAALGVFESAALISCRHSQVGQIYDINHEALVRNWSTYRDWVKRAHSVSEWLSGIFKLVSEAKKTQAQVSRIARFEQFFTASHLRSANDLIGAHGDPIFLSDLVGGDPTFSTYWVEQTVKANNIRKMEEFTTNWILIKKKLVEAKAYNQNVWNQYRFLSTIGCLVVSFIVVVLAVVASFYSTNAHILRDAREILLLKMLPETYSAKKLLSSLDQAVDYAVLKISNDKIYDKDLHPKLKIMARENLKIADAKFRMRMSGSLHLFLHDNDALKLTDGPGDAFAHCIASGDTALVTERKDVAWRYQASREGMSSGWFPAWRDESNHDLIVSNVNGDSWTQDSVICSSPDHNWQLIWYVNSADGSPQEAPIVRNIEWVTLPSKEDNGGLGKYVNVGGNRGIADENSRSNYRDLFGAFPEIANKVHDSASSRNTVRFLSRGHWIGFSFPVGENKTAILWTTTGLGNPEEVTGRREAKVLSWMRCEVSDGNDYCAFPDIQLDGHPYRPIIQWRRPDGYPACTERGAVCPTSLALIYSDGNRSAGAAIRTKIDRDVMTAVKAYAFSDGYIWLKDDGGQIWRYMVDPGMLLNTHHEMWKSVKHDKLLWPEPCNTLKCAQQVPIEPSK